MEEYCGLTFTVREKYRADAHGYGYRFTESSPFGGWYFVCSEMLEPVSSDEDFEAATDEEIKLLCYDIFCQYRYQLLYRTL